MPGDTVGMPAGMGGMGGFGGGYFSVPSDSDWVKQQ